MAGRKVTYILDVDEKSAIIGIRKVEKGFDDVDKTAAKTSANLEKYAKRANTALVAGLGLAFAAAAHRAVQQGREFESQLAELEAITGITGTQLERLGTRSLELSKIYGTSAANIIEANKLVASVLAEKIDFGTEEGFQELQQISEQAVILAKAAGTDLADAVNTTTSIINQFNLSASESGRVINTLAAGAKFGAAEVPAIGRALVNAGPAAAAAGQDIETLNAVVQVLAANGQVGERAGTALRAVFLRLQTRSAELAELGIENVDIKANGLIETLRQLQPIANDAAAMNKLFGEEAFNAAQILIDQADAVELLQEKVTGTNIAHEQAAVNMDTFDGAVDRLTTTIDAALIPAFTESNGVLVQGIDLLAKWAGDVGDAVREINNFTQGLGRMAEARGTFTTLADGVTDFIIPLRIAKTVLESLGIIESSEKYEEMFAAVDKTSRGVQDNIDLLGKSAVEFARLRGEVEQGSDAHDRFTLAIEANQARLIAGRTQFKSYIADLEDQMANTEEGTFAYAKLNERLIAARAAYDKIGQQIERVNALLASQKNVADAATGNDKEGVSGLSQQIKNLKTQYQELINQPGLGDAGLFRAAGIADQIRQLEELLKKRRELTGGEVGDTGFDIMAEIQADTSGLEQGVTEAERKAHEERMAAIDEEKALRLNADADMAESQRVLNEQNAAALGQAAAQAVLYSDTVEEAAKNIIKAVTAELISRALLAAFNPPTLASIALAPVLAAGASRLASALIPGFRHGVDDFEGGLARVHQGEVITDLPPGANVITNANVERMARLDRALTLNALPRESDRPLPEPFSGAAGMPGLKETIKEAIIEGMAEGRFSFPITDFKNAEHKFDDTQRSIGND